MDTIIQPSLLPYLQSGPGKLHLEINFKPTETAPLEDTEQSPFVLAECSDPYSLIMKVGVASDLDGQHLPLVMLAQCSDSTIIPDTSITNTLIDQTWQDIFSGLNTLPSNPSPFLLAEQISETGRLLPFHSLFYCTAKQCYFHPPCPDCGRDLELCTDDSRLQERGLEPYTTSSRRFLFCPRCSSVQETKKYYVRKRLENDMEDVADLHTLIQRWAKRGALDLSFAPAPCRTCPSSKACFGNDPLAPKWLCCFSFFPFYMLLFAGDDEPHFNFQALLAGNPLQDCLSWKSEGPSPETFQEPPSILSQETTPEPDDQTLRNDAAIRTILSDIVAGWESQDQQKETTTLGGKAPTVPDNSPPADLMETVILSSSTASQDTASPKGQTEKFTKKQQSNPWQTDTISSNSRSFDPAETIQNQPPQQNNLMGRIEEKTPSDVDLEETILLSPQSAAPMPRGHRAPSHGMKEEEKEKPQDSPDIPPDTDPAETIIISPKKKD